MTEISVADLDARIVELEQQLGAAVRALTSATERADRVTQIVLARIGGHFTIDDTAIAWNVSAKTVKRKINRGELTLEQIPGTKVYGIPAAEVFGWAPVKVLRKSAKRERRDEAARS